jgi:FlaA1/EpsC-like NDP-sugar epimerase
MLNLFNINPAWFEDLRIRTTAIFNKYSIPRWVVFSLDNTAVFMVFMFAYLLRFNFVSTDIKLDIALIQAGITFCTFTAFSIIFHSYSGLIRHTTLTDIVLVFAVTTCSTISLLIFTFFSYVFRFGEILTIPISILLIQYVSITVLLFSQRILIKIIFRFATMSARPAKRVLIFGAGSMGFMVKRVLLSDTHSGYSVVGFVDYNRKLHGKMINGLPVYGSKILKTGFLTLNKIDTVVIAINDISPKIKSAIIRTVMDSGLEILEPPTMDKLLDGQFKVRQLKKVKFHDLLGRDCIKLNLDVIGEGLNKKTILVTGAAGSIGSEIVRQLARFETKRIVLVDQAETPMFHLENELRENFRTLEFDSHLADVTNARKMELIFKAYHPDVVFHAAAYKHVPLMEANPHEALRINVGGTKLVTELSLNYGVEKFVMISSDKSVNPSSVMGASKRVCEMIVQSRAQGTNVKTQFVITRFGNVLGSNGSVIPLFTKQIEEGGPITVTHPDITRYFMTIPEACELVLEAGFMGKGGEIFVFDMGSPIKIVDLAHQMIRLSGLVPEKDIKIIFTGLRPGEKLYEELLTCKENTLPTHHPKIKIAQVEQFDYSVLLSRIDLLIKNSYLLSKQEVVELFRELVPEFRSHNREHDENTAIDVQIKVDSSAVG